MLSLHLFSHVPVLTVLLSLTLHLPLTSAHCCIPNNNRQCADNKPVQGWCCGHGRCNIFCCNCDYGCLGSPPTPKIRSSGDIAGDARDVTIDNVDSNMAAQYAICTASTGHSIFTGDEDCGSQLFQALDTERTGKISLSQYIGWYAMRHGDDGTLADLDDEVMFGAVEYFHRFDADGDGFVDEVEMRRAAG